jgi:hypothetical protein
MVCEAIVKLKVRLGGCLCVRSCGCIGDGRGPTRSRRVHGAGHACWGRCSPRVGPTVCGVQEALRVVTFAAGFRCGPVSDVEGSRASGDGAPPWTGATWTARVCSVVSEIRRQTETSDPIMAARPHSAAEFGRTREQCWLWFYSVPSLALALPQGSIQIGAQCCDLRSAAWARPDSDCTGPFKLTLGH